ncbi:hypothetical protein K7J14_03920 [Treponema zuelzerae]|uniref:Uncharacterized protein n=1 Tax=Teretinema zuelzerae TaxID=156 RepID=A0AAE3JI75_9SPIR|nr:hypothetical protein [Teretinema zuelzerae]MCD1653846.1 hypothetical protein [Teretinema zuelzerae]HPO01768.1 hypothetical protein [Treponemataceae bacterium]
MTELKPVITVRTKDAEAWYTVVWTALKKADKYEVTMKVPAVAGIWELYRMDKEKKLNLLAVTHAWYGGLRSQIRAAIDPDTTADPLRKAAIEDGELYFRYSMSDSLPALLDTVWFLHSIYFPQDVRVEHSGRFTRIYLNEKAPDKVYWLE